MSDFQPQSHRPPVPPRDAAAAPTPPVTFPGCTPRRLARSEIDTWEGRLEFWDAAAETAWVAEPVTPYHERPSRRLAALVDRIAAERGSAIECYGSMDLVQRDPHGTPRRILQADEAVYVHPRRARLPSPKAMVVGEHDFPDVVLEVDHTTDVRRGKLGLYEAWGFPEVWVEVPDDRTAPTARRRRAGLTIHRLAAGAYHRSTASAAFPGWTADEIHVSLNETVLSERTFAALHRVGTALGARDGTGPDHDPMLRWHRHQSATAARREIVRQILRTRGISLSDETLRRLPERGVLSDEAVVRAALACDDEADFEARLRAAKPPV